MAVFVNFNICDNSPECSGIAVCPQGAIYWDEKKENALGETGMLSIDNKKCISCGKCVSEDGCPVGALLLADTEEAAERIVNDIRIVPERIRALFVERYGAEPVDDKVCIEQEKIGELINASEGITVLEEFVGDSIQCLLSSIPVEEILIKLEELRMGDCLNYYKCDVSERPDEEKEYPLLRLYRKGKILAEISGYFDQEHKAMLWAELRRVLDEK